MESFEKDDVCRHKISKQNMRVVRVNESVATVELLDEPDEEVRIHLTGELVTRKPRAVCSIENLELIERPVRKQLDLF